MLLAQGQMYGHWMPPLFSRHGVEIDNLNNVLHVFMLVLFLPWLAFFLYCLVRFRRREGQVARYSLVKASISKYGEIAVAIVEVILLVGFSMPVWAAYKNAPPKPDNRFELRVVAQQFQWNFHYPGKDGKFGRTDQKFISASNPIGLDDSDPASKDDLVTVNECHLPTDQDIYVRLTSKDVIHDFDIPTMRVKQDVIPGMEIPIWFKIDAAATADTLRTQMTRTYPLEGMEWYRVRHFIAAEDHISKTGEKLLAKGANLGQDYKQGAEVIAKLKSAGLTEVKLQPAVPLEVICAQLCGNSHYKMKALLTTHDRAGFDKWMEEKKKSGKVEEF